MSGEAPSGPSAASAGTAATPKRVAGGVLDPGHLVRALPESVRKLDPRTLSRNPVMFVTEIGAVLTTVASAVDPSLFGWVVTGWLWLTVVFGNLAEAVAESRGRAQADTLRRTRQQTVARTLRGWREGGSATSYTEETVAASSLERGDVVRVDAGELIPGDGDVVQGAASVDESAITGESAPVIREAGGDRCAVTGGTKVLSDCIVVRITQQPGASFLDRMIVLVEGSERQRTPNELALNLLLAALTFVFLMTTTTLQPFTIDAIGVMPAAPDTLAISSSGVAIVVLVSLLVCLTGKST